MNADFNHFTLVMTREQAFSASHPGPCDRDVLALSLVPAIARQLRRLRPEDVHAELREHGWSRENLTDDTENLQRILWIAAGDIVDGV